MPPAGRWRRNSTGRTSLTGMWRRFCERAVGKTAAMKWWREPTMVEALGTSSSSLDVPKISVIMATHNSRETVAEALASIEEQTYTNWELVVCDDGSNDGTYELLQDVAARLGPRMVLLRNEKNRRLAYSLNRCIQASSGEFLARMDGDDLSLPTRFERQMGFLRTHPEFAVVGTGMQRFNDSGLGDLLPPVSAPNRDTLGRGLTVPFFHATILAHRTMFDTVGGYTVSWRTERGQDLDLWFKFFHAGLTGANINEPLYLVREDAAAIRRRTPRSRLGGFITRMKGSWMLRYPAGAYLRATADLLKAFIPYRVFDWHRRASAEEVPR